MEAQGNPRQQHESSSSSATPGKDKGKRSQVTAACYRCRQRKQKCDAIRPVCSRCRDSNTECYYETINNETPRQGLKRRHDVLEGNYQDLLARVQDLAIQDDAYALQLLRRIRDGESADSVLGSIKGGDLHQAFAQSSSTPSSEPRADLASNPTNLATHGSEGSDDLPTQNEGSGESSTSTKPPQTKPWDL